MLFTVLFFHYNIHQVTYPRYGGVGGLGGIHTFTPRSGEETKETTGNPHVHWDLRQTLTLGSDNNTIELLISIKFKDMLI